MNFFSDKRGVSEVLGAVLVFALVLMLLVLIQTLAVPAANERVEFDHNQRVHGDFLDFQQGVDVTAARGSSQTANVEAGLYYPNRFFLLNPPPASGNVRTEGSYFRIENATAVDPEAADYWQGTAKNFSSNAVRYRPNYNNYQNAPTTVYEHGLSYNRHPNAETTLLGTSGVVDGNRITLLAVDGNLSTTTSSTVALETEPLSAPMQRMSIRDTSAPITLTLRTGMSNDTWTERLEDEEHVVGWQHDGNLVTITLERGVVYDLQMAKVGVGSGASDEPPTYLTGGGVDQLVEQGNNRLTVEARDRFNNPKSGVNVTFELVDGNGSFVDSQGTHVGETINLTTAEDGQAVAMFDPARNETVDIVAKSDLDGDGDAESDENETVWFWDVAVVGGDDDGLQDEINPNAEGEVILVETSGVSTGQSLSTTNVSLTFKSRTGSPEEVVGGRVNFHSAGGPGGSGGLSPDSVEVIGTGTTLDVAGEFEQFDNPLAIQETETEVHLQWDDPISPDHFYVLTLEFANGEVNTYFVSHPAIGNN